MLDSKSEKMLGIIGFIIYLFIALLLLVNDNYLIQAIILFIMGIGFGFSYRFSENKIYMLLFIIPVVFLSIGSSINIEGDNPMLVILQKIANIFMGIGFGFSFKPSYTLLINMDKGLNASSAYDRVNGFEGAKYSITALIFALLFSILGFAFLMRLLLLEGVDSGIQIVAIWKILIFLIPTIIYSLYSH